MCSWDVYKPWCLQVEIPNTDLSTSLTAMHSLFLSIVVLKDFKEETATKVSGLFESDLLAD